MNYKTLCFLGLVSLITVSCNKAIEDHADHKHSTIESYYTCSMHPQVKEKEPGKCPICHMNLVKVEVDKSKESQSMEAQKPKEMWVCESNHDITSEHEDTCPIDGTPMVKMKMGPKPSDIISEVKIRKAQREHFRATTFPVSQMKMVKKIRLLGTVLQSEERESKIPAKIGGRVEKVFIKSTGSLVTIDEPVVEIYSPKLITGGEEYLLARKSYERTKAKEARELLKQSEERLKLWGVRENQMNTWFKENKVPRSITIYSDVSGIVQKKNAVVGRYFEEGQNLFELTDIGAVWVEMDVYEQDSALVKNGQAVELRFSALPGEVYEGVVDFINPILDAASRTLKVRTTIENTSGKLRPGMLANANLKIDIPNMPLVVPRSAVIDTGKRKVVWVKKNDDSYQAKIVETGVESEGYVAITAGLSEDENVVIEGNFLLDAQAQLMGGYENFNHGGH